MIQVRFFPENKEIKLEGPLTVKQLFRKLNLLPQTALVIRNGKILTSDLTLKNGDEVEIRIITSRG